MLTRPGSTPRTTPITRPSSSRTSVERFRSYVSAIAESSALFFFGGLNGLEMAVSSGRGTAFENCRLTATPSVTIERSNAQPCLRAVLRSNRVSTTAVSAATRRSYLALWAR